MFNNEVIDWSYASLALDRFMTRKCFWHNRLPVMGACTRFPFSLSSFPVFFCSLFLYLPPCSFPLFAIISPPHPIQTPHSLTLSSLVTILTVAPSNLRALLIISPIFISALLWTRPLSYTHLNHFGFLRIVMFGNDKMAFSEEQQHIIFWKGYQAGRHVSQLLGRIQAKLTWFPFSFKEKTVHV